MELLMVLELKTFFFPSSLLPFFPSFLPADHISPYVLKLQIETAAIPEWPTKFISIPQFVHNPMEEQEEQLI